MNPVMEPNLTLIIVGGVLITAGVYLLLERSLTRILVGVLLAGNGVNLLFLVASGAAGGAPIIKLTPADEMSDPLPQAMVLTAIVITLGMAAFLLTLAYRSFQLNGNDEVADDVEDRKIRELADADLASASYDETDTSLPSEDERVIISEDARPAEPESAESESVESGTGGDRRE
jgi:multicomponent Na+:H+ antiporter subunit C